MNRFQTESGSPSGAPLNGASFTDHAYMGIALVLARRAGARGEIPVGAIVVHDGRIIGRGYNLREADTDPTAHAEIIALRQAAETLGHWRVLDATLYATLEPCAMCAGALVNARVDRLVYGCPDPKAGAVDSLYRLACDPRLNHRVEVTRDVRADECAEVLRAFFRARRRKGERQTRPWRGGRVVEGA